MILDRVENASLYFALHPSFAKAFEFLKRADLASLPAGRHEIAGDGLYAVVVRAAGKGLDKAPLEAHRNYIDIQVTLAGAERIGYKPTAQCGRVSQAYNAAKDIEFFADASYCFLSVGPGMFAVFYPADAHAPLAGDGQMHKIVLKVAV